MFPVMIVSLTIIMITNRTMTVSEIDLILKVKINTTRNLTRG